MIAMKEADTNIGRLEKEMLDLLQQDLSDLRSQLFATREEAFRHRTVIMAMSETPKLEFQSAPFGEHLDDNMEPDLADYTELPGSAEASDEAARLKQIESLKWELGRRPVPDRGAQRSAISGLARLATENRPGAETIAISAAQALADWVGQELRPRDIYYNVTLDEVSIHVPANPGPTVGMMERALQGAASIRPDLKRPDMYQFLDRDIDDVSFPSRLEYFDFDGFSFRGSRFMHINFNRCKFDGADLTGCEFWNCKFDGDAPTPKTFGTGLTKTTQVDGSAYLPGDAAT